MREEAREGVIGKARSGPRNRERVEEREERVLASGREGGVAKHILRA